MQTYQGKRHGKAMMLENGVVSWEYSTVTHGISQHAVSGKSYDGREIDTHS